MVYFNVKSKVGMVASQISKNQSMTTLIHMDVCMYRWLYPPFIEASSQCLYTNLLCILC